MQGNSSCVYTQLYQILYPKKSKSWIQTTMVCFYSLLFLFSLLSLKFIQLYFIFSASCFGTGLTSSQRTLPILNIPNHSGFWENNQWPYLLTPKIIFIPALNLYHCATSGPRDIFSHRQMHKIEPEKEFFYLPVFNILTTFAFLKFL